MPQVLTRDDAARTVSTAHWSPGTGATTPRSGASAEHDLDEAELKPYLQLERMIEAAFACAQPLVWAGVFKPLDVPLYHPDCRAWEVTRGRGTHVAIFIGDYFARGSKRSGAWCSAMRGQAKFPNVQGPVVINVCNFAKGDPALLDLMMTRERCSTNSAMPCIRCCRT